MLELAEFRKSIVLVDGRFRDDRLLTYLAYEDHWPLLIKVNNEIVGFALVRKSKPDTHLIGEFFIKSEFPFKKKMLRQQFFGVEQFHN